MSRTKGLISGPPLSENGTPARQPATPVPEGEPTHHLTTDQVRYTAMPGNANKPTFAVREPFPGKTSAASIVFGSITEQQPLRLTHSIFILPISSVRQFRSDG
jgi:hypothetical protein